MPSTGRPGARWSAARPKFAQFFYTTDNLDGPVWDSGVLHQKGASVTEECIAAAVETGRRLRAL